MSRLGSGTILALLMLASSGAATAQVALRGPQSTTDLPGAAIASSAGASSETPGAPPPSEPKSVAGMLAAQNAARARLGLAPLAWSPDLTSEAEATARSIAETACSRAHAEKTATDAASVFWAPSLRGLDGQGRAQELSASYVVSQWSAGRADYDRAQGECRRSGHCQHYARMIAPEAREVGCGKAVCAGKAQVWACHYAGAGSATPRSSRPKGD